MEYREVKIDYVEFSHTKLESLISLNENYNTCFECNDGLVRKITCEWYVSYEK